MNRATCLMAALGALAALTACESVESEEVLTSGMYAKLSAISDGTSTRAEAVLKVGGQTSNTFVELTGEDELSATVGEETQALAEYSLGEYYAYIADFGAVAEGDAYTFSLTRFVDDGAPASVATLPAPFSLTSPAAGAVVSRTSDALTVSWDSAGTEDEVELVVSGDCFTTVYELISGDPGTYVIEAGVMASVEGQEDQACDATVELYRKRTGTLDAGWGEGNIWGAQLRTVSVRVDP